MINVLLDSITNEKLDYVVNELYAEFAGRFDRAQVKEVMDDSVQRLAEGASVLDYLPLMAYRFTRERLNALDRAEEDTGTCDLVYVSLSGGGRSQIAAALTKKLSGDSVTVHCAGTSVHRPVDPGVRTAIDELGLDPDEAFARPVTDEVLRAADVIVTMGHSVGVVEIPPEARHEDWRIGDPIGAPLAEIRRVRGDIEYRVRSLLETLNVPPSYSPSQ